VLVLILAFEIRHVRFASTSKSEHRSVQTWKLCPYKSKQARHHFENLQAAAKNHASTTMLHNKVSPKELAQQYKAMAKSLTDAEDCMKCLDEGTIAELAHFSRANTAAAGLMIGHAMQSLFPDFNAAAGLMIGKCFIRSRTGATDIQMLQKDFTVGPTTTYKRGTDAATRIQTEIKGYGVRFTLTVLLELIDATNGNAIATNNMTEDIHIKPDPNCIHPFNVNLEMTKDFHVGKALALWHAHDSVDDALYDQMYYLSNAQKAQEAALPRHNARVEAIYEALNALRCFVDHHSMLIGSYTKLAQHYHDAVVPWAPHFWKGESGVEGVRVKLEGAAMDAEGDGVMAEASAAPKAVLSGGATSLLARFYSDQRVAMRDIGPFSNALQVMYVLKAYVALLQLCYDSIDSVMKRALYAAVGPQHGDLLKGGSNLDARFHDVGMHWAKVDGLQFQKVTDYDDDGYEMEARVLFPGDYFKSFDALCREREFMGNVRFGGAGGAAITVEGISKRWAMAFPTAEDLGALPQFRIDFASNYMNPPVAVLVGSPGDNGDDMDVNAAFILKNGLMARLALETAAIPSNKTHSDALARLTTEMASLASGLRACDLANAATVIQIVPLRKLLAFAVGLKPGDLAGDWQFEEDLVNCIKAGCSLKTIRPESADREVDGGFTSIESNESYVALIKQRVRDLLKSVLARGAIDEPMPFIDEEATLRSRGRARGSGTRTGLGGGGGPAFRSMGADCDDDDDDLDDDLDDSPPEHPPEGASAPRATGISNKNFVASVMKKLDADGAVDRNGFSAAKITQPHPERNLKFAESTYRREAGKAVIRPAPGAYKAHSHLATVTSGVAGLFRAYRGAGVPIETTAHTLYGVFSHVTKNLLTDLMSGSRDPSRVHSEVLQALDRAIEA
tara:strand:- start:20 stop:2728 length:2709 start_codon:yes stop_codon:yes gene_type:complete